MIKKKTKTLQDHRGDKSAANFCTDSVSVAPAQLDKYLKKYIL